MTYKFEKTPKEIPPTQDPHRNKPEKAPNNPNQIPGTKPGKDNPRNPKENQVKNIWREYD